MWKRLHVKYPLFLSDFNETLIFSTDFRKKKAQMSSFVKIRPVEAELLHADRQTDMTKLIVAFRDFAKAHKNVQRKYYCLLKYVFALLFGVACFTFFTSWFKFDCFIKIDSYAN